MLWNTYTLFDVITARCMAYHSPQRITLAYLFTAFKTYISKLKFIFWVILIVYLKLHRNDKNLTFWIWIWQYLTFSVAVCVFTSKRWTTDNIHKHFFVTLNAGSKTKAQQSYKEKRTFKSFSWKNLPNFSVFKNRIKN